MNTPIIVQPIDVNPYANRRQHNPAPITARGWRRALRKAAHLTDEQFLARFEIERVEAERRAS